MFRRYSFLIYLALAFLALSGIFYFVHYLIFRDVHHIFIYMVGDLAFLPLGRGRLLHRSRLSPAQYPLPLL